MPRTAGSRRNAPQKLYSGIGWIGLDELNRDLHRYGQSVPRLLGQALHDAAQTVVVTARQNAESLGGVAAKVAPSLRAGYSARMATVSLGSNAYPMALGAEFGAKHDIPRNTTRGQVLGWNQFQPWSGNQWEKGTGPEGGYFLGPAIRPSEGVFLNKLGSLLDVLEQTVFFERAA